MLLFYINFFSCTVDNIAIAHGKGNIFCCRKMENAQLLVVGEIRKIDVILCEFCMVQRRKADTDKEDTPNTQFLHWDLTFGSLYWNSSLYFQACVGLRP